MNRVKISIDVGGLIFVVLFVLKLLGMIEMSWLWVLTSFIWVPLLILAVVFGIVAAFGIIVVVIAAVLDALDRR